MANKIMEPTQGNSQKEQRISENKLNVNKASFEDLIGIKGIGPAKAQAILDYIESNGELVSLDELLEIRGIGKGLLAKLKIQLSL